MVRCPLCQAEMPPHATACADCQPAAADDPAAEAAVTIRNRPRPVPALPPTIAEDNQPDLPVEVPPAAPTAEASAAVPSESQECRRLLAALESLSADKLPVSKAAPE